MWLSGFYNEAFDVESYLALRFHVTGFFFSVLFSTVITSFGEERAGPNISRTFICL